VAYAYPRHNHHHRSNNIVVVVVVVVVVESGTGWPVVRSGTTIS
jgi:hypothetical protein